MAGSPWRRGDTKLQVNQGVEHEESATVPSAPGVGKGTFWVRSDAPTVPMFTNSVGTDFVLNTGGGSATAGLEGFFYNGNQFYVDANDRNSFVGTGTTWTDLIGAIDGTMTGITLTNGHFNFDGTTSNVTFTKGASIDNIFAGGGTISTWIRVETDGENNEGAISDTSASTTTAGWTLRVDDESGLLVDLTFLVGHSTTQGLWNLEGPLERGQWYNVIVTYDSDATTNDPTFYINGVNTAFGTETTPAGTYGTDAGNDLVIGNRSDGARTFDGDIDQVLLFDRVLSSDEVKQLFRVMQDRLRANLIGSANSLVTGNSPGILISSADGGATSGVSGDVIVQTGDTFGTSNTPGSINFTTGTAGAASAPGGSIISTLGAPGAGGVRGLFTVTHDGPDTAGTIHLNTTGTNGASVVLFAGTQDPNTLVSATPGSLYLRNNTTSSSLYVNTGTGTNTTWTDLAGGGASTLVQVDQTLTTGSLGASGGTVSLNITSFINKGSIISLSVTRTAGTGGDDVDIEVFTKDTFLAADRIYFAEAADASTAYIDRSSFYYEDEDTSTELHVKVTNQSAAAATFDVNAVAQGAN